MEHLDGLTWRKSSYSGSNGGNCIEVATTLNKIGVRDSKDQHSPVLAFGIQDWQRFINQVKESA